MGRWEGPEEESGCAPPPPPGAPDLLKQEGGKRCQISSVSSILSGDDKAEWTNKLIRCTCDLSRQSSVVTVVTPGSFFIYFFLNIFVSFLFFSFRSSGNGPN